MALNIVTVVGARPQFIKAAAFSRWVRERSNGAVREKIIHTGQHYDENMSDVFFRELDIPAPSFRFEIGGTTHGKMTGAMIGQIEDVLLQEKPDCLLIYGDTNSTLAGAIAAAKLHVPIAHVEAGLRSSNRLMPEEINRVVSDQLASRLYCPSQNACKNLAREGIVAGVLNVGDIMYDVALHYRDIARNKSDALTRLGLTSGQYILSTVHRAENTDVPERLEQICAGIGELARHIRVVLPLHPRTRNIIREKGLQHALGLATIVDPLPFLDMIRLQTEARAIVTDSGGIQKEAYFYGVPCVTVRDQTEWTETVDAGWNRLVQPNAVKIADLALSVKAPLDPVPGIYGDGDAARRIGEDLLAALGASS
jgi:UDP-GlcNAc3NAcA epimerase